jgi:hypothetical protein
MNSLCTIQGVVARNVSLRTVAAVPAATIVPDYNMFVNYGTSTIPTIDYTGTYAITNNYPTSGNKLTMVNDATRGYVLCCNGTGQAASIGSVGYLTTPFTYSATFSVCQWVKMITTTGNQVSWAMGADSVVYLQTSTENMCGGGASTVGSTPLTNIWKHYVCTYNGATATLYINGSVFSSFTASIATASNVFFLNTYNYSNFGLNGYIDNFRYYKRVITAAEVSSIYNYEKANPTL